MPRPIEEGFVPWPEELASLYRAKGYWRGESLAALVWEVAGRRSEHLALVDGDVRLSYSELVGRAGRAAEGLRQLGLGAGDRIVLQLPNCWQFLVLTLACLRRGVVPVMALPAHRRQELHHMASHSEAAAIAVKDRLRGFDHQALALELASKLPELQTVLVSGSGRREEATVDLDWLCQGGPGAPGALAEAAPPAGEGAERAGPGAVGHLGLGAPGGSGTSVPSGRDVAFFLLSGGTTGFPKLIARTNDDYAYNVLRSCEVCGFDEETVYMASLPVSHNFPLGCPGVLGALLSGGRVVMLGSPSPPEAFATIAREGVTHTAVVPAVAIQWIAHAAEVGSDQLATLRVLQVGGARIAEEVARQVRPVLGATLQQVFGMAEGLLNYTRLDDPEEVICATQGRPMCEDDEVLVVDELDRPVPEGAPGLLLARGPYTIRGYYRAPEHNALAFTADGWYRTGDVVRMRPDGNLVVEGRAKDLINRGGEKVSAEEVEEVLYRLPGVLQAAAVAVPDEVLGERVCAVLVMRTAPPPALPDVQAFFEAAGVARYKWPERLEVLPELPLTKVGKVDKARLREQVTLGA